MLKSIVFGVIFSFFAYSPTLAKKLLCINLFKQPRIKNFTDFFLAATSDYLLFVADKQLPDGNCSKSGNEILDITSQCWDKHNKILQRP